MDSFYAYEAFKKKVYTCRTHCLNMHPCIKCCAFKPATKEYRITLHGAG